jgi:predicted PurR-regulated permease PerM
MPSASWIATVGNPLQSLFAIALVVGILSRGQDVIVPIALAVFIAFVLNPAVYALERRVPRVVAIGLVLTLALALVGGFAYVLTAEFREVAARVPQYSASVKGKLATLRLARVGAIADIQRTVEDAGRELDKQDGAAESASRARSVPAGAHPNAQPVVVVPGEPTDMERLRTILAPVVEPLLEAGVVSILVIFMLMQREDLRNRVIRMVGKGRVTLTTRTLDEAGQRISRFLFTQSMINAGFGVIVTAGLFAIGVQYALLWGVAAAVLRFVPFLGAILAMVMPAAVAAVQFEGWWPVVETAVLFVGTDLVVANLVEPVLIGRHTGVSSLALLMSALFWTWLWGPVGLLLSTPITVCLAVLGKHVPQFEFLSVLLGDDAVLEPEITVYQRLLAGDEDEANEIAEAALGTSNLAEVLDGVLLPAVLRSARDRAADDITEADHAFVLRATTEIMRRLGEVDGEAAVDATAVAATAPVQVIIGVPARNTVDELAIEMLSQLLDTTKFRMDRASTVTLVSDLAAAVDATGAAAVCVAALPPGGLSHARYLCKRLRARFPQRSVILLRPGSPLGEVIEDANRVTSLAAARTEIERMLPSTPSAAVTEGRDRSRSEPGEIGLSPVLSSPSESALSTDLPG